ncbi:uncharacterized protein LOC128678814 [Plodia interpunctella]|uniref:uncharacterized protein LOC128678814 n=1 Tax=Plodia interpunctella TaxID=58824 RepID=UPI0023688535|nr:uncharacterized protein LOC128678814 [Plodia interpunctella]
MVKSDRNMQDDKFFSITNNRLGNMSNLIENNNELHDNKMDKSIQTHNKFVFPQKIPACWLKVCPAPESADESLCSTVFRCCVCQLGIATFLVIWTVIWIFIINYYEEPYEIKVSRDFEKQQNQLVIDLATELRQITPLSPKWKEAIWKRIGEERKLTMQAVGRGAILQPGQYWTPAGTFLFTVYVMTALGFGAPVPQTLRGRTAALLYAILAVPTHIYLMVNLSTCIVCKVGRYIRADKKSDLIQEDSTTDKNAGSPTCSRNSDVMKGRKSFRERILHSLRFLWVCRGVPLAAILYYSVGAVAFGVCRGKKGLDVAMFPLEFTTSGGLEHVEEHVRFLYGFYVEGAMTLLSCVLATIRLHSMAAAYSVADHYKLFDYDL